MDSSNVRLWSRGVDTDIFHPQPSKRLDSDAADLPVRRPRGGGEERRGVPRARSARIEVGGGHGPGARRHPRAYPARNYLGLLDREELAKVYAAADVFVFPSKTDTFGLVLLEAMACGLPVAAYPVTGSARCHRRFEGRRAARGSAHRVSRGAQAQARGRGRAGGPVHLARGDRAVLRPPASAQARLSVARVRVIP